MNFKNTIESLPVQTPVAKLVWTAVVETAPKQDLGLGARGHRYIVPIIGGEFFSGPDIKGLDGEILPGGADRQLVRSDGVKELDALYEMKIHNGPIITVRNKVIVHGNDAQNRYALSIINAQVELGEYDWLTRRILIGTLQSLRPEHSAVVVRAWETKTV